MKFGVFFLGSSPRKDYARTYSEILEQADYAEELGFDSVWLAEHHRSEFGTMPRPAVMAAAIAERTARMRIGVGVSILPFDNPVRVAEDWAMVDVLSGGRLNFGAGRGYQPREFEVMRADPNASREVFAEALDVILGLWNADGLFTYKGEHFEFTDIEIYPKPVQQPIPVWVAAVSPATFKLAASRDLQVITGPGLQILDELKEGNIEAARILIAGGRDPASIDFPMHVVIHLHETREAALQSFEGPIEWYFDQLNRDGIHPAHARTPARGYETYIESAKRMQGAPTLEGAVQAGIALVGDPEDARARVRELRDEIGLKQLLCVFNIGDITHEDVLRTMKLWAEEVMPHFSDDTPVPTAFLEAPDTAG